MLEFHLTAVGLAFLFGWAATFSDLSQKSSRWTVYIINRIVALLCVASITFEPNDLVALSVFQTLILTIVSCTFAIELGETVRLRCYGIFDVYHHILGLFGTALLVHNNICGGMMVRLYLDITTHWMLSLRGPLNRRDVSLYLGDKLYWTYFICVRFIWYPVILCKTLWQISSQDYVLKLVLTTWLLFSFGYHITMFKDQFQLRTYLRLRPIRSNSRRA